jgi:hypothetical protein
VSARRLSASGTIVGTALATIVIGSMALMGVTTPAAVVLASVAVFSYIVFASGQLVLRASRASELPLVAAWPLGIAATSLALLALVALLPFAAAIAFALWAAAIVMLGMRQTQTAGSSTLPSRADVIGLALCCALTAAWCRNTASAPAVLATSGTFPAWIDYFLHAGIISQFGDPRAVGRGAIWLVDTPWFYYHYASYTLGAVFAAPLDQPGLPLATSIWVPIGVLALATSAYALGAALGGAAGGVAALAALFVLPDPSNYGLRNGFFSFHWGLFAIPTTGYALAVALMAIVFLHRWVLTRSYAALGLSAALALGTALFRMHVFILLFPAWLAIVALTSHRVQQRRTLFLILAGACAIATVLALQLIQNLPAGVSWVFDEGRALERFLHDVHRRQEPTAYQGLYQRILTDYGEGIGHAAGILLVYPACLGILVVLYPLALYLGRKRWAGIDGFPLALLLAYAAVLLFAPVPSHHDATDFTHRPFVLLYAVIAIWTAASLAAWIAKQGKHGTRLWQTLVVALLLALPLVWTQAAEMARPKFYWSRPFVGHKITPDLLAGAEILRSRSRPGDTFVAWRLPKSQANVDLPTEIVALTGLPAYLARFWIQEALGGSSRDIAVHRYRAISEISQTNDPHAAMQKLKEVRIRLYMTATTGEPAWDPNHRRALWARGAVAIYDLEPQP